MLEKNGTLFNKDKTKKLDYTKLGSRYDIVISELKGKKQNGNITKMSYIRLNNYNFTMNEKALLNYLYAEGYTDKIGQ
jgi:hypothetical protein